MADESTNPGRMSYVFFSHRDVVELLATKKAGWLRRRGEDSVEYDSTSEPE